MLGLAAAGLGISALGAAAGFFMLLARVRGLERFAAAVTDHAPQILLFYDEDERLVRESAPARDLLAGLNGRLDSVDGFLDFMFSCSDKRAAAFLGGAAAGHYDFREVISHEGRTCLVLARQMPEGGLIVHMTDITDIRQSHDELARLDRQNRDLLAAVEAASNGIVIMDATDNARVLFANGAFCRQMRRRGDDILGRPWDQSFPFAVKSGSFSALVPQQKPETFEWKDGPEEHPIWHELAVTAAEGGLYIGVLTDKTEARNHETQIFQVQKLEALGQLAGGVAHDFNNVLSIIDGYTRMAEKHVDAGSPLALNLERIKMATRRGAALTKQLLTFGRHKIIGSRVIDFSKLVTEQEPLMRALLDPSINMKVSAERGLFAESAPDSLAQIVMNLVINARDALADGGTIMVDLRRVTSARLRVPVKKTDEGREFVCLSVTDTGCGMTAEVRERIFDPFFTTKVQGKGTGLGLSMVYGIVRQAGGYIDVVTAPGQGTTMLLYFPASAEGTAKAISESAAAPGGLRFDGYTVMVAEDEPDLLNIVAGMLEDMGMEVVRACNGNDALLKQDDYDGDIDILLTDVMMPELNGVRLAQLMAEVRPDTHVMFMSGYPSTGQLARVPVPDGAHLLAKPLEYDKLARLMKAVLQPDTNKTAAGSDDMNRWQVAV